MTAQTKEAYYCPAQTYAQTMTTPAEYCENEVDEEDALCEEHDGSAQDDASERAYEAWKERDL